METKGVVYLDKDSDLQSALSCFTQNKISHIPIVDESKLVGMVSKTDVTTYLMESIRDGYGEGLQSLVKETPVKQIMVQPIVKAQVSDSQMSILEKLIQHNVGSVVICANDKIVGILTERDMIKFLCQELDDDLSFSEKLGFHVVDWLNKNGIIRLSSMLADVGI